MKRSGSPRTVFHRSFLPASAVIALGSVVVALGMLGWWAWNVTHHWPMLSWPSLSLGVVAFGGLWVSAKREAHEQSRVDLAKWLSEDLP